MVHIEHEQIKQFIFCWNNGVYLISDKGMRQVIKHYKQNHCCEICGSKTNLTFHHTLPKRKKYTISDLMYYHPNITERQFLRELNQCQLLCRNCHDKIENQIKNAEVAKRS